MSTLWDLFIIAFADGKSYATNVSEDNSSKAAAPSAASPHRKQQSPSKYTADKSTATENTTPASSPNAFASLDKTGGRYMASVRRKRRAAATLERADTSPVEKAEPSPVEKADLSSVEKADPSPAEKASRPPNAAPKGPNNAQEPPSSTQHAVPPSAHIIADLISEKAAPTSPKQASQETASSLSSASPLSSSDFGKEPLPSSEKAAIPPSSSSQRAVGPSSDKIASPPMQEVDPTFQEASSSAKDRVPLLPFGGLPFEWKQSVPFEEVRVPSEGKKTAIPSGETVPPSPM